MPSPSSPVYDKLKALSIELPVANAPAAAYVMCVQTGNQLFLSGHIARRNGGVWTGKLGLDMETDQGRTAARGVAIGSAQHASRAFGRPRPRVAHCQSHEPRQFDTRGSPNSTW